VIADGKSLWMDQPQQRFFLIPDDAPLADGGFVIRTLLGKRRDVAEAALAPFEIARAEADARVKAQLTSVFGGLKDTIAEAAGKARTQGNAGPGQQALDALAKFATDLNDRLNGELAAAKAPDSPKDPPKS
jgi:hypothetical protein